MKKNDPKPSPSEEALNILQTQIREIIEVCESLRNENTNLRKQALGLMADKKGLIRVNETARERLQLVIGRLRELESTRANNKSNSN